MKLPIIPKWDREELRRARAEARQRKRRARSQRSLTTKPVMKSSAATP